MVAYLLIKSVLYKYIYIKEYSMTHDEEYNLFADIANHMIDRMIDLEGLYITIAYLLDIGCTKDELLYLEFNAHDIDEVRHG